MEEKIYMYKDDFRKIHGFVESINELYNSEKTNEVFIICDNVIKTTYPEMRPPLSRQLKKDNVKWLNSWLKRIRKKADEADAKGKLELEEYDTGFADGARYAANSIRRNVFGFLSKHGLK